MRPKYVAIHHSATEDEGETEPDAKAIRRYHVEENDWSDIGYHALVELVAGDYEVIEGRPDDESGAHTVGYNDVALGLCLVGDFTDEKPPREQVLLAVDKVVSWCEEYGIHDDDVKAHRELDEGGTSCPGDRFPVNRFRDLVRSKLAGNVLRKEEWGVREQQRAMSLLRFGPGPIDGVEGEKTRSGRRNASAKLLETSTEKWTDELEDELRSELEEADWKQDELRSEVENLVREYRRLQSEMDSVLQRIEETVASN